MTIRLVQVFVLSLCIWQTAYAAPFGIEIFLSPGDGVDEIQVETHDAFSVYLAHKHGAYGSGTFYFDATVAWDTTAFTLSGSEWVQPHHPSGNPSPYTATIVPSGVLFDVDWFLDDYADGDELIRLDLVVLPGATTGVEILDVSVPTVTLTVSSPTPVVYDYSGPDGSMEVAVTSTYVPGDYDQDGAITVSDYTVWRETYGSTTDFRADGNLDGVVDAADYTVWRDRLSTAAMATIPSARAPVPEPNALMLMSLIPLMLLTHRDLPNTAVLGR